MNSEKLSRREKEKLMHRRQMLAAGLDLFSKKGYHNVSMHEIAKKAEFAIGTLYKFFKNKKDLYKALIMEKAQDYHRVLRGTLSKENDIMTIIGDFISAKAKIFAENTSTLRLYLAETRGASFNIRAGLDKDIGKLYDELLAQLVLTLENGIREKLFRDLNPYYMAVALEGLTNAFLFCWLEDPDRYPYEENVPLIKDLFLKGCMAK
jgi:TetR/AcrR family transcriptional regulator